MPSPRAGVLGGPLGTEPGGHPEDQHRPAQRAGPPLGQQRLPDAAEALPDLRHQQHRSGTPSAPGSVPTEAALGRFSVRPEQTSGCQWSSRGPWRGCQSPACAVTGGLGHRPRSPWRVNSRHVLRRVLRVPSVLWFPVCRGGLIRVVLKVRGDACQGLSGPGPHSVLLAGNWRAAWQAVSTASSQTPGSAPTRCFQAG